jgi:hypothetical protein
MTNESSQSYKCRYCEKEYRKESTLAAHLCEPKRRWQQEKETGVQLGLRAYLRFYEITQGSARLKSYADFVASPFYNAFVKFGRHLVGIKAVNPTNYLEWLLKNNKKLDQWCKDSFYDEWLIGYLQKESPQDALERGMKEMQQYAEDHPDLACFNHFFMYGNNNAICHRICNGRISPWLVYNSNTGVAFLERLDQEQTLMILPYIDPDQWQRKFRDYAADVEWCKHVLQEAGL